MLRRSTATAQSLQNSPLHHKSTYACTVDWHSMDTVHLTRHNGPSHNHWHARRKVSTHSALFCECMISVLVCGTNGPPAPRLVQRPLFLRKESACRQPLVVYTGIVPSVPVHSEKWGHPPTTHTNAHVHTNKVDTRDYSESGRGCDYARGDTGTI